MVNAVSLVKTFSECAPKFTKSMANGTKIQLSVADAISITKNPQVKTKFIKPSPKFSDERNKILRRQAKLPDCYKEVETYTVPLQRNALTDLAEKFVELCDTIKSKTASLIISKDKAAKGGTVLRATIVDGEKDIAKMATKISSDGVQQVGGSAFGETFYSVTQKTTSPQSFVKLTNDLNVDLYTANARVARAKATGLNLKKPEMMTMAVEGKFEPPMPKGKTIRYVQEDYKPETVLPNGVKTLCTWFALKGKRLGYAYPGSGYDRGHV